MIRQFVDCDKMRAHQKQSRNQLKRQKELREASTITYLGKRDLLATFEQAGIENADVRRLRDTVRRLRVLQENKGAI